MAIGFLQIYILNEHPARTEQFYSQPPTPPTWVMEIKCRPQSNSVILGIIKLSKVNAAYSNIKVQNHGLTSVTRFCWGFWIIARKPIWGCVKILFGSKYIKNRRNSFFLFFFFKDWLIYKRKWVNHWFQLMRKTHIHLNTIMYLC